LTYSDLGTSVVLVNGREAFPWHVLVLDDPVELATFRLLDQPRSIAVLAEKLAGAGHAEADARDVEALLGRWIDLGIVFRDNTTYVHVVPLAVNSELARTSMRQLQFAAGALMPEIDGADAAAAS
jgi:hypothetical protein